MERKHILNEMYKSAIKLANHCIDEKATSDVPIIMQKNKILALIGLLQNCANESDVKTLFNVENIMLIMDMERADYAHQQKKINDLLLEKITKKEGKSLADMLKEIRDAYPLFTRPACPEPTFKPGGTQCDAKPMVRHFDGPNPVITQQPGLKVLAMNKSKATLQLSKGAIVDVDIIDRNKPVAAEGKTLVFFSVDNQRFTGVITGHRYPDWINEASAIKKSSFDALINYPFKVPGWAAHLDNMVPFTDRREVLVNDINKNVEKLKKFKQDRSLDQGYAFLQRPLSHLIVKAKQYTKNGQTRIKKLEELLQELESWAKDI